MMKPFMSRLYNVQYKIQRYWWLRRSQRSRIHGKCLVFHHINDTPVDTNVSCQCKPHVFECVLDNIAAQGYRFVSVGEALSIMDMHSDEKFAVVTFDDVPDDMFTNGYPILRKKNIPFTVFVTVGFIGNPGFLSFRQLTVLNAEPLCTIGAHTITHPRLKYSPNAVAEIGDSKRELEKLIRKSVDYFAYPYGRLSTVSEKNIRSVEAAGFKCAFSTVETPLSDYTSRKRWFLPRLVMNHISNDRQISDFKLH